MKSLIKFSLFCLLFDCVQIEVQAQKSSELEKIFLHPPASAKPWVLWYWMHAAVSKEGISADLEAMKDVGIRGAYIVTIQDTLSVIPFQPTVRQLTPEWWDMVKFSMQEAKRLGLQLALHVSDGFALAGGPWITPELSMQKLVWTKTYVKKSSNSIKLTQPETNENYYKDVAVYAYPASSSDAFHAPVVPQVTSSSGEKPQFLAAPDENNKQSFKSDTTCWIQYQYPEPFTCRSVRIHAGGNNYQAQRLLVQKSDDGKTFATITRLQPPRHGWQDTDEDYTYTIPATKAKYFRFVYDKTGTEPGSEDLDAAKWKPSFKVMGIYVGDEPLINNYEGKNGSIWRVSTSTTAHQVADSDAVSLTNIVTLSDKMDDTGNLNWAAPAGWVIVRIGHTSTGHTNATGGAGKGLECDKFNEEAIKLQFNNWFARAFEKTDAALAKEVLKTFYIDSWECGSQNWSRNFKDEFLKRRGYDLMPYLLVMTGVPVQDAATSEKVLHDVRQTIAELVTDIFYKTLNGLAREKGCTFTAESVAPTMVSDGLLHYKNVDIPMGEFWLNSPTHDKPNDMLDAISGARIYGKNIIQAEAFTTVRMNWGEHPGMLKTLQDRNYASGANRLVYHVFAHNPFLNKKPGVTLDGVGLYFQRDQTWWRQGKAWVEYATRCQALLQSGKPVADIAVFTGEEVPRRSVLPDRLVPVLPGLFGTARVLAEQKRLANTGEPLQNIPDGVVNSANTYKAEDWVDPLNGYQYDCLNPDILQQAVVRNGRITLPGGANYGILVLPGKTKMDPNGDTLSNGMQSIVLRLINAGAKVILPVSIRRQLKIGDHSPDVVNSPFKETDFTFWGIEKDVMIIDSSTVAQNKIAWTHRQDKNYDIYFISNQQNKNYDFDIVLRAAGRLPELYNPVNGSIQAVRNWRADKGLIRFSLHLDASESTFIIFQKPSPGLFAGTGAFTLPTLKELSIGGDWQVQFDTAYGGSLQSFTFNNPLPDWSKSSDPSIRYYSGTAVYSKTIQMNGKMKRAVLDIGEVANIATVKVNGINCGTVWTPPFTVDITKALKTGKNRLEIEVTNTWHNRLIGDNLLPPEKRITWTTAPFRLKDKPLLPAGITGNIKLMYE